MKINTTLLNEFKNTDSQLLAVTKYLNTQDTQEVIEVLGKDYSDIIVGVGENRIDSLKEKDLDREITHFIGNVQTKQIKDILKYCSTIHSIDNIKQIRKIEDICNKSGNWVKIFLQINVDETKPGGITIDQIPEFLERLADSENISLLGFSAIGKSECSIEEKQKEFELLKELKAKYIQNGLISAGTSRDYKIALENEIDIIRIGTKLYE